MNTEDEGCNNNVPSSSSVYSFCTLPSLIAFQAEDLAAIARLFKVTIAARPSRETVMKLFESLGQMPKQVTGLL